MKKYIYLLVFIIVSLYWAPLIWFFSQSVRLEKEIFAIPPRIIPSVLTLEPFEMIFSFFRFGTPFVQSFFVAGGVILVTLLISIPTAYGLSRYPLPGSNWILLLVIGCRMIVPAALLVPLYKLLSVGGLINTPFAIIIGHLTLVLPLGIWLLKTYFDGLPIELEESAKIDGMSTLQTIRKIIIPLSAPGITVVALFAYMLSWMDYMFATSLATSYKVGSTAIAGMVSQWKIWWAPIAAGGIMYALPMIIIVLFLQKYIVKGVTAGAIK